MRKRKRKSIAAKRRSSRADIGTRRDTTRLQAATAKRVRTRRTKRRVLSGAEPGGYPLIERKRRDRVPDRLGERRRGDLRRNRRARQGLSPVLVSVRRTDENASGRQTTRSVCTRKKAARRAVIIATGYGGRNGARRYKRQEKCR